MAGKLTGSVALRRSASTATVGVLAGVASVLGLAVAASAHVEVKPGEVEGGDFAEVAFTVPNEIDTASTTKVVVDLPADQPLASVMTTPIPGWKITTKERKLAKPIDYFGSPLSKVVSQITWTATAGGISPGQFEDFPVSLGVLPTSGELTFKAVQTYSNGTVVKWDEISAGGAEPEHPAPVLALTASAESGGETTAPPTDTATTSVPTTSSPAASDGSGSADSSGDEGSSDWAPITLSIAALAVALAALGLAWRRGRP
jgi:periplasmic copper chaperone A